MEKNGEKQHEEELAGVPALTKCALLNMERRRRRRRRREPDPDSRCLFHDNSCPGYGWLLPGWIAEERVVKSGRLYKYYYDPAGQIYRTKHEVLAAWEKSGIISIN